MEMLRAARISLAGRLAIAGMLVLLTGACRFGADPSAEPPDGDSTPADAASVPTDIAPEALGQAAALTAEDPLAEINLRAEPTVDSAVKRVGLVGDRVQIVRSTEGTDGYTWHYIRFEASPDEGWVRGDFVTTTAPTSAQPSATTDDALGEALDSVCGGPDKLVAYFGTPNYDVYICDPGDGLLYVGREKGSDRILVTGTELAAEGTGYVAVNNDFEYRISDRALAVFRRDGTGQWVEVLTEPVTATQRY